MKKINIFRSLILLTWLIGIGYLIKLSYFSSLTKNPRQISVDRLTFKTPSDSENWMGVYLRQVKIGHVVHKFKKTESGFQLSENSFMELNLRGDKKKVYSEITAMADQNFHLLSFDFSLITDPIRLTGSGKIVNKKLFLKISSASEKFIESKISLKSDPMLWLTLSPSLIKKGLTPQSRYTMTVFDPFTLSDSEVTMEVMDKEKIKIGPADQEAYKIKTSLRGMTVYSWIDEKGEILKEESPIGFTLIKETKEQAVQAGQGEIDFLNYFSIPVNKEIKTPQQLNFLKVKLLDVDLGGFTLNGGRQALKENILEIRKENLLPDTHPDLSPYLKPDLFIQSDSLEIKEQLQKIVGEEKDQKKIIRLILSWMNKEISKEFLISIPNALDVLKIKKGDCNEHATLFTALARAAGIPTKLVIGIIYAYNGFYYHAWNEVYLRSWVSIDSLMNQFPADITHIRFMEGGLEQQTEILKIMGRIKLEVMEYK